MNVKELAQQFATKAKNGKTWISPKQRNFLAKLYCEYTGEFIPQNRNFALTFDDGFYFECTRGLAHGSAVFSHGFIVKPDANKNHAEAWNMINHLIRLMSLEDDALIDTFKPYYNKAEKMFKEMNYKG